jgi:hypothetical protein
MLLKYTSSPSLTEIEYPRHSLGGQAHFEVDWGRINVVSTYMKWGYRKEGAGRCNTPDIEASCMNPTLSKSSEDA